LNRGFALGETEAEHFPCVETVDALYVFDQGMLTCFELATGQARWRLTSVGISRVQADTEGKLYVNTTSASVEVIDFPKQFTTQRPQPVIMKVDPANGKVLWKVTSLGDECTLTGKFVYAARSSSGAFGTGTFFNIYRLNPANGKELWNFYAERWPRNTGYFGNRFMLQWKDEVQVLKFLTL
jgi:outer membrane protein assembly factor BamB